MQDPELFVAKFPKLAEVVGRLNANNIDWMISGSGCLWFYGNKRLPNDVDFFLRDEQHDVADKLFGIESFTYTSPLENVRNSNPFGDHDMQLTSHLRISVEGRTYSMSMGDAVFAQRKRVESSIGTLWLIPPEDALLIKALLQRGPDMGKQDLDDIKSFLAIYAPNMDYLQKHIAAIGAEERVKGIFALS
ncbi:MAG: hypothetical protein A2542_00225 [Parcubacteria group bacterium RIFOXYD2_FULL_52_8]|nr:MAG: hypothetical protein A2542_00225 [Parcubacteria group bacterium RIFOXYD2_FULL_52_8]